MSYIHILFFVLVFAGPARLMKAVDWLFLSGLRGWVGCFSKWLKNRAEKKSKIEATDKDGKPLN